MNEPTRAETMAGLTYRCVCGESFAIEVGDVEACCPSCGRHYAPEAFRAAQAATLTIGQESALLLPGANGTGSNEVDERIGERLDHFQIVELLGAGGMGAVYKALDESLQRYVALKVVRAAIGSTGSGSRSDKIIEEARAQARVSHPNVVHIYYVGRDESAPFFAMELVSGPPLAELLERGPLEFSEVINVALQVVDALEQSAAFDIVHGDIKPSNILIAGEDKTGRTLYKLSDFGLAKRISKAEGDVGSITGTPDYLSPEAALGEPLVQQSDMYSLGITLFQLTFGRLPYARDTTSLLQKLEQHTNAEVEFPEPWPVRIPELWRNVLRRMMAKSPGDRFAKYEQLRRAILQLQPVELPQAGRLPRLLAWMVDLALLLALYVVTFGLMHGVISAYEYQTGTSLSGVHFFIALASTMIPAAGMALQTLWGTTPGKAMFQLRIVTPHGLAPPPRTLAARSLFQFFPIWLALVGGIAAMLLPPQIVSLIEFSGAMFLLVDAGMALFHPAGRSLHDWALHTRVVVRGTP